VVWGKVLGAIDFGTFWSAEKHMETS